MVARGDISTNKRLSKASILLKNFFRNPLNGKSPILCANQELGEVVS